MIKQKVCKSDLPTLYVNAQGFVFPNLANSEVHEYEIFSAAVFDEFLLRYHKRKYHSTLCGLTAILQQNTTESTF